MQVSQETKSYILCIDRIYHRFMAVSWKVQSYTCSLNFHPEGDFVAVLFLKR